MFEKYIANLKNEFSRFGFPSNGNDSYHSDFLHLFSYYHYFDGDSSKIDEIFQGDLTNKADGIDNIDGVFIDEEADDRTLDILISYPSQDLSSVEQMFQPTEIAIFDAIHGKGRKNVLERLKNLDFTIRENTSVKIILLTDSQLNVKDKNQILKRLEKIKSTHQNVSYRIYFGNEIESEILEIEDPKEYVSDGSISIDDEKNILRYGKENSLIVNASSLSIKKLYEEYGYRGLFSQNLRYYVKNAKIDESIVNSIENRSDDFWYFNNGLIIICDDYQIVGNHIELKKFSIINGGQTTYLIGETDFEKPFYLQCKIIKNNRDNIEDKIDFIADVAEASNTQKPIKTKDLIANRKEQRMLKNQLANASVFCSIKRGQKINKKVYSEPWQNTNNEEIGQFLFSFLYQQPGFARNNKSSLTSMDDRYKLIYRKNYSDELLVDLLKLKMFYKLWLKVIVKENSDDVQKIGLAKNGLFFMSAIIGLLSKLKFHPDYLRSLKISDPTEKKLEVFSQYDISHPFVKTEFDLNKEAWFDIFDVCYQFIFATGYQLLKSIRPNYMGYSNFTKTQQNYNFYILANFINQCISYGMPSEIQRILVTYFYDSTKEDKEADTYLLTQYVNSTTSDVNRNALEEDLSKTISEKLKTYRTNMYHLKHIKAYEIMTNKQVDRIATYGADSLDDLMNLKCLDQNQISEYGNDILNIIQEVKENYNKE